MNHLDRAERAAVPPASRRRRVLKVSLATLLLLVGLPIGWWLYSNWAADREMKAAVAEMDRLEPGNWRLEDLEAKRRAVPDEQNAALVVMKVRRQLPRPWPAPSQERSTRSVDKWIEELPPEVRLYDPLPDELRRELDQVRPALDEARPLANLTQGRFPLAGKRAAGLEEQEVPQVVKLLWLDAVRRAEGGDADGALASCRGALVAARSVGDAPTLMAMPVRITCQPVAVKGLKRALAQGEPSEEELRAAQRLLQDEAAQPLLEIALRGERGGWLQAQEAVVAGELTWEALVDGPRDTPSLTERVLGPLMARKTAPVLLRTQTEWINIAKLPLEEWQRRFTEAAQKVAAWRDSDQYAERMVSFILPAVNRMSESFLHSQARLRTAAAALAAERYRRAHGRWPESLDALAAAGFLERVPADPFDGKPLRFRRLADGVVIYSAGPDLSEGDGRAKRKKPLDPGSDLAFRLWDVAHRRQPPAEPIAPPGIGAAEGER